MPAYVRTAGILLAPSFQNARGSILKTNRKAFLDNNNTNEHDNKQTKMKTAPVTEVTKKKSLVFLLDTSLFSSRKQAEEERRRGGKERERKEKKRKEGTKK